MVRALRGIQPPAGLIVGSFGPRLTTPIGVHPCLIGFGIPGANLLFTLGKWAGFPERLSSSVIVWHFNG